VVEQGRGAKESESEREDERGGIEIPLGQTPDPEGVPLLVLRVMVLRSLP